MQKCVFLINNRGIRGYLMKFPLFTKHEIFHTIFTTLHITVLAFLLNHMVQLTNAFSGVAMEVILHLGSVH